MKKDVLKSKTLSILLACATMVGYSATFVATAHAEEMKEFSFDAFVVTASRVQTNKVDTPANITVITSEKLNTHNYADAADALRDVPGVNILSAGTGGANMGQDQILLNGDSRVLVMIDGRRVNVASTGTYSSSWLPPINTIERIEVLKGSGSALYGTDAVGGVINIITKSGAETQVTAKVAGGSWGTEQYGISASGSNENGVGLFVTANKNRRSNYSYKNRATGDVSELANSYYDSTGATIKLDKKIGKDNKLTLEAEHFLLVGGSPFGTPGYANTASDSYERLNNNVSLRYDWNLDKDNSGFVQAYKNYHHANFYSTIVANISDFSEDKYGIEAQQNWKFADNNHFTAGVDYYDTKVNNNVLYENGENSVNNKAVYVEDRWGFAPSWQLNSGLRYDKHSTAGGKFTPHFAVNKKFNEDSNAYISWGRVFNAPNTDTLFWYQPGYSMFGNLDLKPETGSVLTIGFNTKTSASTLVSASYFNSKINDAIDWESDANYIYKPVNIDSEKRQGIELAVNHKLSDSWSLNASYTYLHVEKDKGSGFTNDGATKPNIYRAGVRYKNAKWIADLTLRAGTGQDTTRYTSSSYATLDIGAQYKINKNIKVFAQLNNLNNAAYEEIANSYNTWTNSANYYYPMPSRNFVVGMEYNF
jgi:Outer membrane receptor for ferrienterochelin and colicins